jgi:hypothetical protein
MTNSTTSSETPAGQPSSSLTHIHLGSAGPVEVTALADRTAVLNLGAHPARLAIFFPDLQTLWTTLVEGERQAAHLATEPPVDPTVVGDGSAS